MIQMSIDTNFKGAREGRKETKTILLDCQACHDKYDCLVCHSHVMMSVTCLAEDF